MWLFTENLRRRSVISSRKCLSEIAITLSFSVMAYQNVAEITDLLIGRNTIHFIAVACVFHSNKNLNLKFNTIG